MKMVPNYPIIPQFFYKQRKKIPSFEGLFILLYFIPVITEERVQRMKIFENRGLKSKFSGHVEVVQSTDSWKYLLARWIVLMNAQNFWFVETRATHFYLFADRNISSEPISRFSDQAFAQKYPRFRQSFFFDFYDSVLSKKNLLSQNIHSFGYVRVSKDTEDKLLILWLI